MSIKHYLYSRVQYNIYATVVTLLTIFTTQAMQDHDFTHYLMTHFGSTVSYVQAEDHTTEFYASITHVLQQKTLYDLVLLAHAHSKLLANTRYEDSSPIKKTMQALLQHTIAHVHITQNDTKQFDTLTDHEVIRYALSVLSPLRHNNDSTQTFCLNKIMLMLKFKLKPATTISRTTTSSKKNSLGSSRSQPSTGWVMINTNTTEELYQEVTSEMVNTVVLTEEYINKNKQQQEVMQQRKALAYTQDNLSQEYSITRSIEHDLVKILQDYQNTSPTNAQESLIQAVKSLTEQRQTREKELAARLEEKKLLEQTNEQLRNDIASIAQLILEKIDSTIHRQQAVESEKIRLKCERQELIKEQMNIQEHITSINTQLSKLDAIEHHLLEKQKTHTEAKKALARVNFNSAVNEGKLLLHQTLQ